VFTRFRIEAVGQNGVSRSSIRGQFQLRIIEDNVAVIADAELTSDLHRDSYFWAILGHTVLHAAKPGRQYLFSLMRSDAERHAPATAKDYNCNMRYLVRARVKPGREADLLDAIERGTLGEGSVAEGEYLRNMKDARLCEDQTTRWVEVCYCPSPLLEERPYWEEFFDLTKVQDAHDRRRCKDENGTEAWACNNCDCTERLEQRLAVTGESFLDVLRQKAKMDSQEAHASCKR
jgi:hypothetical protein